MPAISVIVPVFNTEEYVARCIESILSQTFSDFELIMIDDGSTDSSGKICDEYSLKDHRIIVIHKDGSGVSDSRNVGLDCARGKYITFVDSDDAIFPDTFMICVQSLKNSNTDCVCFGYNKLKEDGTPMYSIDFGKDVYHFQNYSEKYEFLIKNILKHKIGWEVCFRMFRGEIIRHNHIRFHKDNVFGEDIFFTSIYTMFSESAICLPDHFYNYYDRNTSARNQRKNIPLNEINSLSYYLHEYFLKNFEDCENYYPIIHYFILNHQLIRLKNDEISALNSYIEKFEYFDFYRNQIELLYNNLKKYESFIDKEDLLLFRGKVTFLYDNNYKKYKKCLKRQKIREMFYKVLKKLRG